MINFTHQACCADGENADKVARRLKKKIDNPISNYLEPFLSIRFAVSTIPTVKLTNLSDFPKMSKAKLTRKIFFGSYYMKQSRSYLADLMKNGNLYVINDELIEQLKITKYIKDLLRQSLKTSKIIGVEMASRHKRTSKISDNASFTKKFKTTYKIFIHYVPNIESSRAIKCN
jgi:hypothetical protein